MTNRTQHAFSRRCRKPCGFMETKKFSVTFVCSSWSLWLAILPICRILEHCAQNFKLPTTQKSILSHTVLRIVYCYWNWRFRGETVIMLMRNFIMMIRATCNAHRRHVRMRFCHVAKKCLTDSVLLVTKMQALNKRRQVSSQQLTLWWFYDFRENAQNLLSRSPELSTQFSHCKVAVCSSHRPHNVSILTPWFGVNKNKLLKPRWKKSKASVHHCFSSANPRAAEFLSA